MATTKKLQAASTGYLVWATGAALVAIARNLPAGFGGLSTGLSVTNDFLMGLGTALSPPLWWMIPQAVCTALAGRESTAGRVSTGALIGFGASEFVGALGEPVTFDALNPSTFDALLAVTQLGMILLPLATMVYGVRAWRARR